MDDGAFLQMLSFAPGPEMQSLHAQTLAVDVKSEDNAKPEAMVIDVGTAAATSSVPPPRIKIHHRGGGRNAKTLPGGKSTPKKYTEAERVEKHRAVVRRGYYQKKARKEQLRQELGVLEEQYRAVMAQSKSPPTSPLDDTPHCSDCERVESLRQSFKEQVLETEALRRENATLERRLWQHTDFLDKVQWYRNRQTDEERLRGLPPQPRLLFTDSDEQQSLTQQRTSLTTTRRGGRSPSDQGKQSVGAYQGPVLFEPLTESECAEIAQDVQQGMCSQRRYPGFRDVGPPVMGWNRKHKFGETSQFSLLKRFYGRRASALAARAWELYTTSGLLGKLYSACNNVRFDMLQRIDANNVLMRRVMRSEGLTRPKTTYFLMARRVATTCGSNNGTDGPVRQQQQLLFRSLDTARIPTTAAEFGGWVNMFYWISFDDCEPGDDQADGNRDGQVAVPYCQVEFGGDVLCISVADTAFWTMEFLSYTLRLENYAVGSVFNINL